MIDIRENSEVKDLSIAKYLRQDRLPHIWCPGCGIGPALGCFLRAIDRSGVNPDKICVVSGIGCAGRVAGYVKLDSFHTTHGRAIPFATGLKLANPELNVSQTADGFVMEAHPKLRPVDAPTPGIFFAGSVEAPKDIKDSVTQAGAAVARSSILLNSGVTRGDAIRAEVDLEKCTSCGVCAKVCPFGAVEVDIKAKAGANIITAACTGCGTCAAECRFDAITIRHFHDEQILAQISAALAEEPEKKIITSLCNWCSYAAGDMAGISRMQYPPNNRFIRVMCSARVKEKFIWHAFKLGAPIVLLSGCHIGDCHYINANHWTMKRADRIWEGMEKLGIRPERMQLEWISAAEGPRFMQIMHDLEGMRQKVTSDEIEHTKKVLTPENFT